MEKATFGAGCFWGVEETFRKLKGVEKTAVGYSGGNFKNPTYEDVCSGKTGHAEVIYLEYDPIVISYEDLLKVFWDVHDPTTVDRQGPDLGSQYRSAIFYHSPEQKNAALKSKGELDRSGLLKNPVVTEISPAVEFYQAEDYHQQYIKKNR